MLWKQEKDKREFYEKSQKNEADGSKKIENLEKKVSEYRRQEQEFLGRIKILEEELEGKDEEIDNLLANLENNELVEKMMKLTDEKEALERELGSYTSNTESFKGQNLTNSDVEHKQASESIEFELRKELNELREKAKEELDETYNEIEKLMNEKVHMQEQLSNSEAKARDFENMMLDLEFKFNKAREENQEEALRQQVRKLKEEVNQMTNSEDKMRNDAEDLNSELKEIRLQLEDKETLSRKLQMSLDTTLEEKKRIESRLKECEKELREDKLVLITKDKKAIELQQKANEIKSTHTAALEKLNDDHAQAINKLQEELSSLKSQNKMLKKELEERPPVPVQPSITTSQTFDHSESPEGKLNNLDSPIREQDGEEGSPIRPKLESSSKIPKEDNSDKNSEEAKDEIFETAGIMGLTNSGFNQNTYNRRDTLDSKGINQSRRNSGFSTGSRLRLRGLGIYRSGGGDEKLQAELNELKIRLRELQDSSAKKSEELLSELEEKNQEIITLNEKLAEKSSQEMNEQLAIMENKHKEEALQTELKNLKADMRHLEEENEYCRQAAAESSFKVATICSEYETNQVTLMKKNRALRIEIAKYQHGYTEMEEAMQKDKVKSNLLREILNRYTSSS